MRLKDKVVLVTGAAGGMGLAVARTFAAEGAKVALNDCSEEALVAAIYSIRSEGHAALLVRADVSNSTDVDRAVDLILERYGRLDILVNNAGILKFQRIVDLTDQLWQKITDVNLSGICICDFSSATR